MNQWQYTDVTYAVVFRATQSGGTESMLASLVPKGEAILPYVAPPPPAPVMPIACSPAQGLVALYAIKGITEADIANIIAAIPDPVQRYTAQIGFKRATEWHRGSNTMQAMAALLGLSEEDLDALFTYAAGVQV